MNWSRQRRTLAARRDGECLSLRMVSNRSGRPIRERAPLGRSGVVCRPRRLGLPPRRHGHPGRRRSTAVGNPWERGINGAEIVMRTHMPGRDSGGPRNMDDARRAAERPGVGRLPRFVRRDARHQDLQTYLTATTGPGARQPRYAMTITPGRHGRPAPRISRGPNILRAARCSKTVTGLRWSTLSTASATTRKP